MNRNKLTITSTISGTTQLAGVIGWPIKHSLSPIMQNAAMQAIGLNAVYLPLGVAPEGLKSLVLSLNKMDVLGVNVTIPYKEKIIPYLDELDEQAAVIGAVNTIVFKNGRTKGYNTDATGFLTCVKKRIKIKGKSAVLLGGGGAGRALAFALIQGGIKNLMIVDTDSKRLKRLVLALKKIGSGAMITSSQPGSDWLQTSCQTCDLLVNATPLGLKPSDPMPIEPAWLCRQTCVMDLAYGKGLTRLLKTAQKKGNKIIPGWEMLLYQGVDALKLWTNKAIPVSVMEDALCQAAGIKK